MFSLRLPDKLNKSLMILANMRSRDRYFRVTKTQLVLEAIQNYLNEQGIDFDNENGKQIQETIERSAKIRQNVDKTTTEAQKHFWIEKLLEKKHFANEEQKKRIDSEVEKWRGLLK